MKDPSALTDMSAQELRAATSAIVGGDDSVATIAGQITRLIEGVNQLSRDARAKAAALRANDEMNPVGRERLLAAIPSELHAATQKLLEEAEVHADVAEGRHRTQLFHHDSRNDFALINEVNNYAMAMTADDASVLLTQLAAEPRYASLMAGPFGLSMAARFRLKDAAGLRRAAFEGLAVNGTDSQRARAAALGQFDQVRRVIGLARAGRDYAAEQVKRPVAPNPSEALR